LVTVYTRLQVLDASARADNPADAHISTLLSQGTQSLLDENPSTRGLPSSGFPDFFTSWERQTPPDLHFRVVGGDGFEPPTPAL